MGKDELLVRALCSPYCSFYKPGKNEELLCRGAVVVKRLMKAGRMIVPKRSTGADRTVLEEVVQILCRACDFREHDCDFMQDRSARPCGGFLLLALLLESGQISLNDIR